MGRIYATKQADEEIAAIRIQSKAARRKSTLGGTQRSPRGGHRVSLLLRACCLLLISLLLTVVLLPTQPLAAQDERSVDYWRYSAPGRVDHVEVADIDRDGINDFAVVAAGNLVNWLNAAGNPVWATSYLTNGTVLSLAVTEVDGDVTTAELVALTATELVVLDSEGALVWNVVWDEPAGALAHLNADNDAADELLVANTNGVLNLVDNDGSVVWQRRDPDDLAADAEPQLLVADFDGDNVDDILYTYRREQFYELALLDTRGEQRMRRPVQGGSITTMLTTDLNADGQLQLVFGTSRGRLEFIDLLRNRRLWFRTPVVNRAVTSLTTIDGREGLLIVMGTDAGSLFAYDARGVREWERTIGVGPSSRVASLSENRFVSRDEQTFALMATVVDTTSGTASDATVRLLDARGILLPEAYPSASPAGLSQLVDVNGDEYPELLVVGFAQLRFFDPGIGAGENLPDWTYNLNAEPEAALITDLDGNQQQELVVGAQDGRVHLINTDGTEQWVRQLEGRVAHIAVVNRNNATQSWLSRPTKLTSKEAMMANNCSHASICSRQTGNR